MLIIHGIIFLVAWLYRKKTDKQILALILCGNFLGAAVSAGNMLAGETPVTELERSYGEEKEVKLEAETELGERETVTLTIPELTQTPSETRELLEQKLKELDGMILGKNSSFTEIRTDLYLPESFDDSPVTILWSSSDEDVLSGKGRVGEDIPESGAEIELRGKLALRGESLLYSRILRVFPPNGEKQLPDLLEEEAERLNRGSNAAVYRLPDAAGGKKITWFREKEETGVYVSLLFLVSGVCLAVSKKNENWKRELNMREEMRREYPEIVGRIQLLLSAGLGTRKIFEKITADYKKQISGRSRARKPAYEEIANTYYEMAGGVSEQEAYENLGARSRLAEYKNLSVLLVQNLKKGRRELIPLLEQEVRTAMEEKRRMARVEGEKAATRLLLPMGMMLLVVLALMMVPAFLSV